MKAVRWILLAIICVAGAGCDTLIDSTVDSLGGGKSESMYYKMWRESDEEWHRQNYGY